MITIQETPLRIKVRETIEEDYTEEQINRAKEQGWYELLDSNRIIYDTTVSRFGLEALLKHFLPVGDFENEREQAGSTLGKYIMVFNLQPSEARELLYHLAEKYDYDPKTVWTISKIYGLEKAS